MPLSFAFFLTELALSLNTVGSRTDFRAVGDVEWGRDIASFLRREHVHLLVLGSLGSSALDNHNQSHHSGYPEDAMSVVLPHYLPLFIQLFISLHLSLGSNCVPWDATWLYISYCPSHRKFVLSSLIPSCSFVLVLISQPSDLWAPLCLVISVTNWNARESPSPVLGSLPLGPWTRKGSVSSRKLLSGWCLGQLTSCWGRRELECLLIA